MLIWVYNYKSLRHEALVMEFFKLKKWRCRMKAIFEKMVAFIATWKTVIIGQGIYKVVNWLWDNPIWMGMQYVFKSAGVVIMVVGSFLLNFGLLFYYRSKKVSWLGWDRGVEALKEKEEEISQNFVGIFLRASTFLGVLLYNSSEISSIIFVAFGVLVALSFLVLLLRALKVRILGDCIAFVLLSIYEDPFITVAYLRHGYVNGLRVRDIIILTLSCILSISYWTIRNGLIVETFRMLVK